MTLEDRIEPPQRRRQARPAGREARSRSSAPVDGQPGQRHRWCSISTTSRCSTALPRRPRGDAEDPQEPDHRLHRPVGLRQDHGAAQPEPDARRDPGGAGRRAGCATHGVDLYGPEVSATEVRRRIGMVFQKPNPFPKSIYDNVAFGPRANGVDQQERAGRHRREVAAGRGAVGRGQGPAAGVGAGPVGRPAAAAVHRPHHRRRARGGADGRAVQRARSHRHRAHRGADARAEEPVHHRHRHPQHAAGRPGQRSHRLLHHRGRPQAATAAPAPWSSTTRPRRSSRTPATSGPRTTSPAASAERRTRSRALVAGGVAGQAQAAGAHRAAL